MTTNSISIPRANLWLTVGGVMMASAVLIGAFGAHGIANSVTEARLITFDTGVKYHFYHAIGILIIALLMMLKPTATQPLHKIACLLLLGIILFSGSLYSLVLLDLPKLGMITPLGGMSWVVAWIWLALTARNI